MRPVDAFVSEPRRHLGCSVQVCGLHRIIEASANPFLDAGVHVELQSFLITSPHLDRRVSLPAVPRNSKGTQYLESLDALLSQSPIIEASGAGVEVTEGEKRLHRGHSDGSDSVDSGSFSSGGWTRADAGLSSERDS